MAVVKKMVAGTGPTYHSYFSDEDQPVERIEATEGDPSTGIGDQSTSASSVVHAFFGQGSRGVAGDETLTHGLPTAGCKGLRC
jgi:hypothetical protein